MIVLVDALDDAGYKVHLANPAAMEQYEGLKHTDDKTDAIWLAEMLRLGILPTGSFTKKDTSGSTPDSVIGRVKRVYS